MAALSEETPAGCLARKQPPVSIIVIMI